MCQTYFRTVFWFAEKPSEQPNMSERERVPSLENVNTQESVMRSISAIAVASLLLMAPCAHAQTADIAKVTCDDLNHASAEDLVVIGSWLSGYYNAKRNNTAVNLKELGANTRKILQFCRTNPQVTAMQAVEQVTGAGH
jgi:acid stress chaperone HdeB